MNVFGGIAASMTFTHGFGFRDAKYSADLRTSSSEVTFAMGLMRASSFLALLLKYSIWRMRYATGSPARSADSGCPWPLIKWHDPHAILVTPPSPVTIAGAGPCSSGNQSGGVAFPAIF